MKRFSRLPSFETLEEKRLKAADVAAYGIAYGPAFEDATDATPSTVSVSDQLRASNLEQTPTSSASAAAEESADESETDGQDSETKNETDDTNDSETDDTDGNETDENDDSDGENESELSADLMATTGNEGSGTAKSESETENGTTKVDLKIKVSGLATDGTYDVMIGSTTLTPQLAVMNGEGTLKLSTNPDGDEEMLPADLVTDGATVKIILAGQTILQGDFAPDSDSDSASLQKLSSAEGSGALQSTPISLPPSGSVSLQSAHPVSSQLTARSAEQPNVSEDNTLDANLLDAGFAATSQPLDSWKLAEFQPNYATDETDLAGSRLEDAVFEMLVEGEYAWIV